MRLIVIGKKIFPFSLSIIDKPYPFQKISLGGNKEICFDMNALQFAFNGQTLQVGFFTLQQFRPSSINASLIRNAFRRAPFSSNSIKSEDDFDLVKRIFSNLEKYELNPVKNGFFFMPSKA